MQMGKVGAPAMPELKRHLVSQCLHGGAIHQVTCSLDRFPPHIQRKLQVRSNGTCSVHDHPMQTLRFTILSRGMQCSHLMMNTHGAQIFLTDLGHVFPPIVCAKNLDALTALHFNKGFHSLKTSRASDLHLSG